MGTSLSHISHASSSHSGLGSCLGTAEPPLSHAASGSSEPSRFRSFCWSTGKVVLLWSLSLSGKSLKTSLEGCSPWENSPPRCQPGTGGGVISQWIMPLMASFANKASLTFSASSCFRGGVSPDVDAAPGPAVFGFELEGTSPLESALLTSALICCWRN